MAKLLLPLALLLVLLALLPFFGRSPEPKRAPPVATAPAAPPSAEPELAPPPAPAPRALRAVEAPPADQPAAAPTLVEFEIREGLAVAFGDVVLGRPDEEFTRLQKTRGFVDTESIALWPHPRIPYAIDRRIDHPQARQAIDEAIRYFNERTPVQWVPFEGEGDAVLFEAGQAHCFSNLGRVGGVQSIRIVPQCGRDEILHEMMHTLGFIHEHSRADRDQYVEVLWPNIDPAFLLQFRLAPPAWSDPLQPEAFDYRSIMIYDPTTFAKQPGLATLRSRTAVAVQPSADGLSEQDLRRVRALFKLDPNGGDR